mgnify:CR=1 FL=1
MHAGTYFKVDKVAPVNEIGKLSKGEKQCSAVLDCVVGAVPSLPY